MCEQPVTPPPSAPGSRAPADGRGSWRGSLTSTSRIRNPYGTSADEFPFKGTAKGKLMTERSPPVTSQPGSELFAEAKRLVASSAT